MARLYRFFRDSRGIAAIETAFVLPFLILVYFGLVDLTSLITTSRKINYAASVFGDLVTQNDTTLTKSTMADYISAAALIVKPTNISAVRIDVYQYRNVSGTLTNQWQYHSTGGTACGAPSTGSLSSLMTDGNDIIVTEVCSTYTPFLTTFLGQAILGATSFNLSDTIALRPRQSSTLTCTDC